MLLLLLLLRLYMKLVLVNPIIFPLIPILILYLPILLILILQRTLMLLLDLYSLFLKSLLLLTMMLLLILILLPGTISEISTIIANESNSCGIESRCQRQIYQIRDSCLETKNSVVLLHFIHCSMEHVRLQVAYVLHMHCPLNLHSSLRRLLPFLFCSFFLSLTIISFLNLQ